MDVLSANNFYLHEEEIKSVFREVRFHAGS